MDGSEYCKLRLDHTLQHTQQATKLIYLVNGAVLALLYFIVRLPPWEYQHRMVAIAVAALAWINFIHALLIYRQGGWYREIDNALRTTISPTPQIKRPRGISTHAQYSSMHIILALGLAYGAYELWLHRELLPKIESAMTSTKESPALDASGQGL
jgi:MFS superfamily sulfate permease-like transporter